MAQETCHVRKSAKDAPNIPLRHARALGRKSAQVPPDRTNTPGRKPLTPGTVGHVKVLPQPDQEPSALNPTRFVGPHRQLHPVACPKLVHQVRGVFTVLRLMCSSSAISEFVRPRATVRSTPSSPSVSGAIGGAGGRPVDSLKAASILDRVADLPVQATEQLESGLLGRIRAYGGGEGEGYDHEEMKDRLAFSRPWRMVFVRSYDMDDPHIKVLHSEDLVPFIILEAPSVAFTIDLPQKVDGDVNPVVGMHEAGQQIIERAW